MKLFLFESSQWLPRPRNEIFEFFSDAFNLERITPPWLQFRVITPAPIEMQVDTRIDYRLQIHGISMLWKTRITAWNPPQSFVDEQIGGPYRRWIHEHRFSEQAGGTFCEDFVRYAPTGGALINKLFVERDVREIFAFRSERLKELFS
jgi:ligand-binding SRPBCC domain-containing protein